MEPKTDSFRQEYELATQHLTALRQQLEQSPDRQGVPPPALEGLTQALLALGKAYGDLSRENEACAARRQDLEGQLAYYRDLFEHALHAHLLTDLSGIIQVANVPASNLLQASQDELSGQRLEAFLPEQERKTLSRHLARLRAGEAVRDWEVHLQPSSGEAVAASLDAVPVHGQKQQIMGLQWLVRDIRRQVQAEAALRQNEHLLRSFVEQSLDGIALTDEQGQVIEWNQAMEQITGLPAAETIGRPIWDVQLQLDGGASAAPVLQEQLKDRILELLRSGRAPWLGQLLERNYVHPDGTCRVVQGAVFPFKTQKGFMLGSISRDVTHLRQTEKTLREREESLGQAREVLEAVTSGTEVIVAAQDASLRYIFFNEAYRQEIQRLAGRDIRLGSSMAETFAHMPEQQRIAVEQWTKTLQGQNTSYRIEFGDPAGYRRVYAVRQTPLRDAQGNVVGAGEVAFDITEQARAEDALRESERKSRLLVDSLHEGIWLIDKDAVTTFVNPRMAEMLGYTVDEMVGAPLFSFVDDKNLDLASARMERQRQGIRENVDFEFRRKDGTPVYVNIEVMPLFDAEGQYTGALAGIADMTERRQAEQERERLLAQALEDRQRIEAISAQAQRQADELGAILNAIPDPVAVWDAQGNVLRANPAAAALGILADERGMVGVAERLRMRHPDGRPIPPEELPVGRALHGEVIRNEAEILVNPAGEEQEVLVSVAPVISGGVTVACVTVSRDISDLRRTEAAMRESEGKLSTLFELMPVGISVMDGERRITQTNAALTHILDLPREALLHGSHRARTYLRSDGTAMPPDEFPSTRAFRNQEPVHDQVGIVKEDGAVIWADVSAAPVPFADWKVVVVTVDVTERKRVEDTLQEERDRLAALVNSVGDEIWFADTEGRFTLVNPSGSREFNLETDAATDVRQFAARVEVFRPDGTPRPVEEAPPLRALRGEVVTDEQEMIRRPATGELRHRQVSAAPVRDGKGNIIGSVSVVRDITVQKQAEEAMQASRQMLETVVSYMPASVTLVRGSDLRLQLVNPAYQAVAPGKDMVGKTLDEVWPETGQDFAAICRHVLETGEPYQVVDELNTIRRRPDGPLEPAYFTWSLHRVRLPGDEGWGLLNTAWETTARKQIEQALRQARDELERRVQERTAELERANLMLLAEIRERTRVEGELRKSEQRLEQRVEERTRELATLLDISNTVALSIDLEPLLALILERLKDVVDYDGGAAFRLEAGTLNPVFHRGTISADDLLQIGSHLEETVLGKAAIPGVERVILSDVQAEPALQEAFRRATGTRFSDMAGAVHAWMTVPVTIKQQVYGVLYMYHGQPGRYTEEQARLALPFGNQAAIAIENARIYEQTAALAALEERQHLARELHDAVTQTLFSASLAAEVLPRLWERDREAGLRCLSEVHQLTRGALAEMRTLLLELRPSTLVETNLGALLHQLAEATSSRARIPVTVQAEMHCSLQPEVQIALYRIAQEALNNAAKHAGARHVEVRLECTPSSPAGGGPSYAAAVELNVADDGRGFDPGQLPPGCKGLGLGIMRERAEAIGAAFQIQSQVGQGTRITVLWAGED